MITPERVRRKDGSIAWRIRFRYGTSQRTGQRKQTSDTFETKKEAEQFAKWLDVLGAQGALDKLYAGEQVAYVPTLDQVAADHIEHLTGIEPGTRLNYQRLWDRTWAKHIGQLPITDINRDAVSRAVNKLAAHYSAKSLKNQRGLLYGVLDRAVELEHLKSNPAKQVRLPRAKEADRVEMRIITPAEFAGIVERTPDHYQPFVRFLAGTGCRWGEAVALTVSDVDLPNVRIRRALKWSPDNARTVGPTKTKKSNRTVTLPTEVVDDLGRLIEGKGGDELVFTAPRGGQVRHRTFWSAQWLPAVEHLTPRPRIHDLRHSHASWLLAQGVPIHIVQARLGHESIQTTVDTYGHLLPDAQRLAAHAAGLVFGQAALEG